MLKYLLIVVTSVLPEVVLACSQMQPVAAFVFKNDKNSDRALNLNEWINAQAGNNLVVAFQLQDPNEFMRFDINRDGVVEARELGFDSVHYVEAPCSRVESRMFQQKMGATGFGAKAFVGQ